MNSLLYSLVKLSLLFLKDLILRQRKLNFKEIITVCYNLVSFPDPSLHSLGMKLAINKIISSKPVSTNSGTPSNYESVNQWLSNCKMTCVKFSILHSGESDDKRVVRRARARSLDTTQHTVTHRYMTHKGSIKTNFSIWTPDSKLFVWIRRKLIKIGRVRQDYSLFLFHKKGRFRKTVKRIVKAKYPLISLVFDPVPIHFTPLLNHSPR